MQHVPYHVLVLSLPGPTRRQGRIQHPLALGQSLSSGFTGNGELLKVHALIQALLVHWKVNG